MEKITLDHIKWPLTVLFSLLAYIFVNQKDIINRNTVNIKENTHAITVIQGNEKASGILIDMLNDRDRKNEANIKEIKADLGKIMIFVETSKVKK